MSTGVTHCKPLAGDPRGKQASTSRSIKAGITDNTGKPALKTTAPRGRNHELATRHPLADIVVAVALKVHVQTARIPDAKTLSCGARELHDYRVGLHAVVTMASRNFPGQARTDGAVAVGHCISEIATTTGFNGGQHVCDHLVGFISRVKGVIAGNLAELRLVCGLLIDPENRVQVEALLFRSLAG